MLARRTAVLFLLGLVTLGAAAGSLRGAESAPPTSHQPALPGAGPAVIAASAGRAAEACFYVVDVGLGNAVFVVSPSGEVVLLDSGSGQVADRMLAFMKQNGIAKIDYFVASHHDEDHIGAIARIAERVSVACFVDHGDSVMYGRDENWWKEHRRPWFRPGMGQGYDRMFDEYRAARAKARHVVPKPGDRLPIAGLAVEVVSVGGKVITQPLKGGGSANPYCAGVQPRGVDDSEDAQSVGVVMSYGKFRFADLGDLTWNISLQLFCPNNQIGRVDAYLVTHHAHSMNKSSGDFYHGLSSCPPPEVFGLHPRVAILSLAYHGHVPANPDAMKLVNSVPGLDLWQTEYISGGERHYNGPEAFIANLNPDGEVFDKVPYIKLAAKADGSFKATNSRNLFTKQYPPHE